MYNSNNKYSCQTEDSSYTAQTDVSDLEKSTTYIKCPNCNKKAEIDTNIVFASYPPQYKWTCPHCNTTGYIQCDKIKVIDPDTFEKTKARFATNCKICGNEILIYGDEDPVICKDCKEAIIAMRKALGTWHE